MRDIRLGYKLSEVNSRHTDRIRSAISWAVKKLGLAPMSVKGPAQKPKTADLQAKKKETEAARRANVLAREQKLKIRAHLCMW